MIKQSIRLRLFEQRGIVAARSQVRCGSSLLQLEPERSAEVHSG